MYVFCTAAGHHHHVVCVDCGATATLEGCALEPVRSVPELGSAHPEPRQGSTEAERSHQRDVRQDKKAMASSLSFTD